jgi:hypothetical protein
MATAVQPAAATGRMFMSFSSTLKKPPLLG